MAAQVMIDTSVWIGYFRNRNAAEAQVIDTLLAAGPVATCAPIRAEVISGAPNRRVFDRLRHLFDALISLEPPANLWPRLEERRFALAKRGYQASLVDLIIALTAEAHQVSLWTLDEDFRHIATVIPIGWYRP